MSQVRPVIAGVGVALPPAVRQDELWERFFARQYAGLAEKPGAVARSDGDADALLARTAGAGAPQIIERVFEAPFLAHASLEPMNCTAHVQADRCDVWVPTQSQTATQQAAMGVTGLSE